MTHLEYIAAYGFRNWLRERRSRSNRDFVIYMTIAAALGFVARHVWK